jgi:hypothetical protein
MNLISMFITKAKQLFSQSQISLSLPVPCRRQQRLVEAWAELHQEELLADWQLLLQGQKAAPIKPLE